ncbi:MAG: hypothetical protein ABIW79_11370 [Gemmatimonas sp.]
MVVVAGLLVLATACSSEPERTIARSELVNVRLLREQGQRVLLLDAAPGARINARLQPVLELDDGTRVAFASDSITADSSYFTGAPRAPLTTVRAHHALLRASACPAAEQVCRSIKIDVALP